MCFTRDAIALQARVVASAKFMSSSPVKRLRITLCALPAGAWMRRSYVPLLIIFDGHANRLVVMRRRVVVHDQNHMRTISVPRPRSANALSPPIVHEIRCYVRLLSNPSHIAREVALLSCVHLERHTQRSVIAVAGESIFEFRWAAACSPGCSRPMGAGNAGLSRVEGTCFSE
jgi:hypothetical protein